MTESTETNSIDQLTPQELSDLITELETYRERLLTNTLDMAQRAKVKKSQAMAKLEPQLAEIDGHIQKLREQQETQTAAN